MIKAKKSLGQNFLKSEKALNKMCEVGDITNKDIILEIGPGKGALTKKLLEKARLVIAVEKDNELKKLISEKFKKEIELKKLILIGDDILNFNLKNFNLKNNEFKIIANIPYNITGAIIKKFLEDEIKPEKIILLVQKEVAQRIVAINKKESILSLSVKAFGIPKYIMKVEKRFFQPTPKIDSAILAITNISGNNFENKKEENLFFKIIKSGFAHKRKKLIKNLESLDAKKIDWKNIFDELDLNENVRPEDINLSSWFEMTKKIKKCL